MKYNPIVFSDIEGLRICKNKDELKGKEKPIKLQFTLTCHTLVINFWLAVSSSYSVINIL